MIVALAGIALSCQRAEILEDNAVRPGENGYGEATVSFSTLLAGDTPTKAMGDTPDADIKSMHLVVFDENGMLVEVREATRATSSTNHIVTENTTHYYETEFDVTLTVTDQRRFIHIIANCPVDQISYGHEISVIGNLYVTKGEEIETAYWARIEVPYILVDETTDENGNIVSTLDEYIAGAFKCIPMLRNYAQIVVTDSTDSTDGNDKFKLLGFTIYNTIHLGTVAPYNNTNQTFQSFLDQYGAKYSYPDLTELNYLGHALAAVELDTELPKDENGDYLFWEPYDATSPSERSFFNMYERKISVKTSEEEKWDESPPHLIIKGTYDSKEYYYKVDLVYNVLDDKGKPIEKKYYNILRNFLYKFTIAKVVGPGYDTIEEAVNGATSNNLSGSATTTKFKNISDQAGRLWVSYTDTTLVNGDAIKFRYKYIPDLSTMTISNDEVRLERMRGEVIEDYEVATTDITSGDWAGYREVTLEIKEPSSTHKEQAFQVKTDNINLSREIRHYLKPVYRMEVECTPKVAAAIGEAVQVDIKLPLGLTEDMFPLNLDIEVYDMSLSPNASMNTLPVVSGPSVIPDPAKVGKPTFHYVKTIATKADYDAMATVNNRKIIPTYWFTNKAANASTVYVVNKYFEAAFDYFVNDGVTYTFSDVQFTTDPVEGGIGKSVDATFTMDADDADYASRVVTVTLNGLSDAAGNSTFTLTPDSRTVNLTGLLTTNAKQNISFSVSADEYSYAYGYAARKFYEFNGSFAESYLSVAAGETATYSFSIPEYTEGMVVYVTMDGLKPSASETKLSEASEGVYTFTPAAAGNYSFTLETLNATEGVCSVTMAADDYYYLEETATIDQANITVIEQRTASFTTNNNNRPDNIDDITTSLSLSSGEIISYNLSISRSNNTYTITITNITVKNVQNETTLTVTSTFSVRSGGGHGGGNTTDYTYTGTGNLENDGTITMTRE